MDNHDADDRLVIWCHVPLGMRAVLVEQDPERIFMPPYVSHHGLASMRLDHDVEWVRVAGWIAHSYRMVALNQLLARIVVPLAP